MNSRVSKIANMFQVDDGPANVRMARQQTAESSLAHSGPGPGPATVVRTESHVARFQSARALFEKMSDSRGDQDKSEPGSRRGSSSKVTSRSPSPPKPGVVNGHGEGQFDKSANISIISSALPAAAPSVFHSGPLPSNYGNFGHKQAPQICPNKPKVSMKPLKPITTEATYPQLPTKPDPKKIPPLPKSSVSTVLPTATSTSSGPLSPNSQKTHQELIQRHKNWFQTFSKTTKETKDPRCGDGFVSYLHSDSRKDIPHESKGQVDGRSRQGSHSTYTSAVPTIFRSNANPQTASFSNAYERALNINNLPHTTFQSNRSRSIDALDEKEDDRGRPSTRGVPNARSVRSASLEFLDADRNKRDGRGGGGEFGEEMIRTGSITNVKDRTRSNYYYQEPPAYQTSVLEDVKLKMVEVDSCNVFKKTVDMKAVEESRLRRSQNLPDANSDVWVKRPSDPKSEAAKLRFHSLGRKPVEHGGANIRSSMGSLDGNLDRPLDHRDHRNSTASLITVVGRGYEGYSGRVTTSDLEHTLERKRRSESESKRSKQQEIQTRADNVSVKYRMEAQAYSNSMKTKDDLGKVADKLSEEQIQARARYERDRQTTVSKNERVMQENARSGTNREMTAVERLDRTVKNEGKGEGKSKVEAHILEDVFGRNVQGELSSSLRELEKSRRKQTTEAERRHQTTKEHDHHKRREEMPQPVRKEVIMEPMARKERHENMTEVNKRKETISERVGVREDVPEYIRRKEVLPDHIRRQDAADQFRKREDITEQVKRRDDIPEVRKRENIPENVRKRENKTETSRKKENITEQHRTKDNLNDVSLRKEALPPVKRREEVVKETSYVDYSQNASNRADHTKRQSVENIEEKNSSSSNSQPIENTFNMKNKVSHQEIASILFQKENSEVMEITTQDRNVRSEVKVEHSGFKQENKECRSEIQIDFTGTSQTKEPNSSQMVITSSSVPSQENVTIEKSIVDSAPQTTIPLRTEPYRKLTPEEREKRREAEEVERKQKEEQDRMEIAKTKARIAQLKQERD